MSSPPTPAAQRESDLSPGQLGLALESGLSGGVTAVEAWSPALAPRAVAAEPAVAIQVIGLTASELDPDRSLSDLEHPVTAYLNGLAPSSRRPQLSALDWIARRATRVYTAETMPWHHLRRPHVLKIRGLLEEHYQPATANRMLSALRGVLKECWHAQLMTTEEYQAALSVPAVRGESERRGRDLSPAELRGLFDACTRAPRDGPGHDSAARRRRDAAFLALAYGCGLRRSEVVAVDIADLDLVAGELRVRRGKGKKPRQVTLPPSTVSALRDWLEVRSREPGPLFCAVLKTGRLVRADASLARLSAAAAWRICRERGRKGQIQAPAPHDLRRTWIGDLLDLGVDLATVQKMAGHASASTTAGYDRRDRGVQRQAAVLLQVPYTVPED